jgi:hypothetical protein
MERDLVRSPLVAILASIEALAASLFQLRDREIPQSDLVVRWEIQAACIRLIELLERLIRLSDDGQRPRCADSVARSVDAKGAQWAEEVWR